MHVMYTSSILNCFCKVTLNNLLIHSVSSGVFLFKMILLVILIYILIELVLQLCLALNDQHKNVHSLNLYFLVSLS